MSGRGKARAGAGSARAERAPARRRDRRIGKAAVPYLLGLPSWVYLLLFFLVPLASMLALSAAVGDPIVGYSYGGHFAEFLDAIGQYHRQLLRSFYYGALATLVTLAIAYPAAYWIAFHGGRHKSTYLFLIMLPFFVSFVIRTVAWQFILADQGFLFGQLKSWGLISDRFYILSTQWAVIGGLVYNGLAYYVLPLYVAIEKIDRRVVRAAGDLYADPASTFLRVILPLSAPGVFAGFLLVFVTDVGDFVNAQILGGPGTYMVGNVIQDSFFVNQDYPMAAALSSILMFLLMVAIFLYARAFGRERIQEYAA
ncbi:spermidine/putrescine transport system permease protein [Tistlia consotensis]|uniref:Spermidine/putrescine transport system permease protein n=1 Tax=Tistlia consotensis USBA 355 TaxID=560819 RepID=A0A1Y6BAD7_9PROT|nr:ABC transporter permease [Tistlia consotensis]SME99397.1 spermidine/putrescine transport system permease protein [Tistlia consotensis USBA 355]SNR76950.1 spermidine/putrescine transport system permease protein [Tistlia consotensis]